MLVQIKKEKLFIQQFETGINNNRLINRRSF